MSTPDPVTSDTVSPQSRTVGILLAAGRGRRFDTTGQQNKLLAQIDGEPVVSHAARALLAANLPVVAVVRPARDQLTRDLTRLLGNVGCQIVVCELADAGMGHSLASGVAHACEHFDPQRIVVALGDMPFLPAALIDRVARRIDAQHTIVAGATGGKRGHPVGFWHSHFNALKNLQGDSGASSLLRQNPVTLVETDCDAPVRDIDRPEDLKKTSLRESTDHNGTANDP